MWHVSHMCLHIACPCIPPSADVSDMREPADVGNGIGTDGMVENGMGTGAHSSPPSGGLLSPVIVPHLQERPQSYLLFEERGQEEGEGYIHVKRESRKEGLELRGLGLGLGN